jgi:hypothetical protein
MLLAVELILASVLHHPEHGRDKDQNIDRVEDSFSLFAS